jgi:hypothetical protein
LRYEYKTGIKITSEGNTVERQVNPLTKADIREDLLNDDDDTTEQSSLNTQQNVEATD